MTVEIVEKMCAVTEELAEIVHKQALIIEEQFAVDEAVKRDLEELRTHAENVLADLKGEA